MWKPLMRPAPSHVHTGCVSTHGGFARRTVLTMLTAVGLASQLVMPGAPSGAVGPGMLSVVQPLAPAETFEVNAASDDPDENIGDGNCATQLTGNCTLRAALQEAGSDPDVDRIVFSPGSRLGYLRTLHSHRSHDHS